MEQASAKMRGFEKRKRREAATYAAGALELPEAPRPDDPDHGHYIELVYELDPTGTRLALSERPGGGCADKIAE